MESTIFFLNKEGVSGVLCKINCVVNSCSERYKYTIFFYIFEYGAEFVAECSAESGAK